MSTTPERTAEPFTALPWAIWFATAAVVVTSTNNVAVLGAAAASCWLTMLAVGGRRAAVSRVVAGLSLLLVAIWVVLGLAIHRGGLGGEVVWFLPEWSVRSGGEFGGAVTAGQLHFALARGGQALAIVAMVGLLAQAVAAGGWLRLAAVQWGRASRLWSPLLCLGEAYAGQREDRLRAIRSGFGGVVGGSAVVEVVDRARAMADDWHGQSRGSGTTLRGLLGLLVVLGVSVWWAVESIDPDPVLDVSGLERTLLALAALTVMGLVLRRETLPRPNPADVVALGGTAALAATWLARASTGDQAKLVVGFAQAPPVPTLLVVSLAALPVLAFALGGRR